MQIMSDHQQSSLIENCLLWTNVNLLQVNLTCNFFLALNITWDKKDELFVNQLCWRNIMRCKSRRMDRTHFKFHKWKKIPTHIKFIFSVKKSYIPRNNMAKKSRTIYNNTNRHLKNWYKNYNGISFVRRNPKILWTITLHWRYR